MNTKIGRNDPCPCGSGKKYKRCHLALDEQRQARSAGQRIDRAASSEAEEVEEQVAPLSVNPRSISERIRELSSQGSKQQRGEFKKLLADAEPVLSYLDQLPDIEAASLRLSAHRVEFERLAEDPDAYQARAEALFAEPRFDPLRFTADEVGAAFAHLGAPTDTMSADETLKRLLAAILELATPTRRKRMAMLLNMQLPHDVAAERFLDGWIIQHCAYETGEFTDKNNPFLLAMFRRGYDAWVARRAIQENEILREVGFDPDQLQGTGVEDIDEFLRSQLADPAKEARLQALLAARPEEATRARAGLEQTERDAIKLFEQEDARGLLLTDEEVTAWLPELQERWNQVASRFPDFSFAGPPNRETAEALADAMFRLTEEMADSIFVPERVATVASWLKDYGRTCEAARDRAGASRSKAALALIRRPGKPSANYFLVVLCESSIRAALSRWAPPTSAVGTGEASAGHPNGTAEFQVI